MNWLDARQKDQFVEAQESMTAALAETIRSQISALPRIPFEFEDAIRRMHAETVAEIKEEIEKTSAKTRPLREQKKPGKSALKAAGAADLSLAEEYAMKLADVEGQVLESLSFPVMWDREDDIAPAELATFEWIFKQPRSVDRPWNSFKEWLKSGQGTYWISGKTGSGESTLMKYLLRHAITKQALQLWADRTDLVIASFLFWNGGNELQKSQDGLLRSLLYQCLRERRELLSLVLPDAATDNLIGYWTFHRLKEVFLKLIQQETVPLRICSSWTDWMNILGTILSLLSFSNA